MNVEVSYAKIEWIPSFHKALDKVAREKIFLANIEAPSIEKVTSFQTKLIEKNNPVFYALAENEVIGWIDISNSDDPQFSHRGFVGMGIVKEFRGQGIGARLLESAIAFAKTTELEQIELSVYTKNLAAIGPYKKFGFKEHGRIKNYRKLDGDSFDALEMVLSLK